MWYISKLLDLISKFLLEFSSFSLEVFPSILKITQNTYRGKWAEREGPGKTWVSSIFWVISKMANEVGYQCKILYLYQSFIQLRAKCNKSVWIMGYGCQPNYNVQKPYKAIQDVTLNQCTCRSSSTRYLYKKYELQSVCGVFKGFSILTTSKTFIDDCQLESSLMFIRL